MADGTNRERGLRDIIRETLAGYLRGGEFGQMLGKARASADAQTSADGIGIDRIRRGVGKAVVGGLGSDITVSATSFAALSTPVRLEMVLSGRPLRVAFTCLASTGASGIVSFDIHLRGESVSDGNINGIAYTDISGVMPFHSEEIVMAPTPGRAVVELVARRETSDATVYAGSNNRVTLTAVEE